MPSTAREQAKWVSQAGSLVMKGASDAPVPSDLLTAGAALPISSVAVAGTDEIAVGSTCAPFRADVPGVHVRVRGLCRWRRPC